MSLTKRLYRIDEVRAALLYCIKQRRVYEACFWLTELEESKFALEARRLLLVAWYMVIGLSRVAGLLSWAEHGDTREGRLKVCWQLARCSERDTSLWWLAWCGVQPSCVGSSRMLDQWQRTCHQEEEPFWTELVDKADDRLEHVMEALQTDLGRYSVLGRCCATSLIFHQGRLPESSWLELSQEEPIDLIALQLEWSMADTLRQGRAHAIPPGCLYGMTWRGSGGDTLEELRGLSLTQLRASPYWKQIVLPLSSATDWNSDDAKESFYDTYFPYVNCNIPDEWSKADQQKSHSERQYFGSNGLYKWWRTWIQDLPHLYLWGTPLERYLEWVKEDMNQGGELVLDRLLRLYGEREATPGLPYAKKEFVLAV